MPKQPKQNWSLVEDNFLPPADSVTQVTVTMHDGNDAHFASYRTGAAEVHNTHFKEVIRLDKAEASRQVDLSKFCDSLKQYWVRPLGTGFTKILVAPRRSGAAAPVMADCGISLKVGSCLMMSDSTRA